MILVYVIFILSIFYNIKIFKSGDFNIDALNKKNSNAIKGLAAVVVVLHHISQRIESPGILFLFRHVGYLAVALYFFYSGYGLMKSYESKKNYLNGFWRNRLPKIMIPFILSNILFIIIYLIMGRNFSLYDILTYVIGIRLIDDFKWYIISIIILYCGFCIIFKTFTRKKAIIGIFFLVTAYNVVCYLIGKGGWWYNVTYCFFIGIIFGAYSKSIFKFIKNKYAIVTSCTLFIFILLFCLNIFRRHILFESISSVLFILSCICLFMKLEIGNKLTNLLGTIFFEIYLVHGIFVKQLVNIIDNKYMYLTIALIGSIIMGYIFNRIIIKIYSFMYT